MEKSPAVPAVLYHATYGRFLDSIMEHGLGGEIANNNKMWDISSDDMVYLSSDIDFAISFVETAENGSDDESETIVVIKIDVSRLDANLLSLDDNILDENRELSWQYNGIIARESFLDIYGPYPV